MRGFLSGPLLTQTLFKLPPHDGCSQVLEQSVLRAPAPMLHVWFCTNHKATGNLRVRPRAWVLFLHPFYRWGHGGTPGEDRRRLLRTPP